MIDDSSVLKKLAAIKEIPTLPEVIHGLLGAIASDDSSADDIAAIISKDQALCSKVLKIANSAFFAQSRRIFDTKDAIILLGLDSIVQLMLATKVVGIFDSLPSRLRFDLYGFWKHSIATAVVGKMIAETVGEADEVKMVYTAGLLHDIGKLVLVSHFSDRYAPVLERLEEEEAYVHEVEESVLGFSHCDISEWLCNRWYFPEKLVSSIANHHGNGAGVSDEDSTSHIVRLANIVSNRMELGHSGNRKSYPLEATECSALGLDGSCIGEIQCAVEKNLEMIDSTLSVIMQKA